MHNHLGMYIKRIRGETESPYVFVTSGGNAITSSYCWGILTRHFQKCGLGIVHFNVNLWRRAEILETGDPTAERKEERPTITMFRPWSLRSLTQKFWVQFFQKATHLLQPLLLNPPKGRDLIQQLYLVIERTPQLSFDRNVFFRDVDRKAIEHRFRYLISNREGS